MALPKIIPMIPAKVDPAAFKRIILENPRSWLFERKWDGIRCITYLENKIVQLRSKEDKSLNGFHNLRRELLNSLPVDSVILDGEIVYLGENRLPVFEGVLHRREPQIYCVFDLLWLNGLDARSLPLEKRKELLRMLIGKRLGHLLYVNHAQADRAEKLFRWILDKDQEGMVVKKRDSPYNPELKVEWMKVRNRKYSQLQNRWVHFRGKALG